MHPLLTFDFGLYDWRARAAPTFDFTDLKDLTD